MGNMAIAQTILAQLGGRRFQVMTGAKNFVGGENYLMFKLPATLTKGKGNYFKITLNGWDLYDIEFTKNTVKSTKTISEYSSVYAEDLGRLFTAMTGLDTHL